MGDGVNSYDRMKAWSSINNSRLAEEGHRGGEGVIRNGGRGRSCMSWAGGGGGGLNG